MKKRFFWEIFNYYAFLILIALLILLVAANLTFRSFYYKETGNELLGISKILEYSMPWEQASDYPRIREICTRLGAGKRVRITVILADGTVIGDSENDPAKMENHAARPEVHQALTGRTGTAIRNSATLDEKMYYLALPLFDGTAIRGVLRVSRSVKYIDDELFAFNLRTLFAGFIIMFFALLTSILIARKIDRPVLKLEKAARAYAAGNFDLKIHIHSPEELHTLSTAMNSMAEQLEERIETISRQKYQLEAILSHMVEPVILLNDDLLVTRVNRAAAELFPLTMQQTSRHSLIEVIRNVELYDFSRQALAAKHFMELAIIIREETEIHLQVHATPLLNENGACDGLLLVMNNITRLVRLENIRRDFVANVSHELKTPITAIQGFVETLNSGALADPVKAAEYLGIIGKQSYRLNAIIDDLLQLSRLEEGEHRPIEKEECMLDSLLANAVRNCEYAAGKQGIVVAVAGKENFAVSVNGFLIEQAVTNLLDNAVKYSRPESQVDITYDRCSAKPGYFRITVTDRGCGIPPADLPHIFERFYRVDKARSRTLGGTGLGLSIVKHIVQVHGGEVTTESRLGEGSTFILTLPGC